MRTRAVVVLAAVLAVLVFAAVAWAVQPKPGSHEGATSQSYSMGVTVNNSHRIKVFAMQWKAPCTNGFPDVASEVRDKDKKGDRIAQQDGTFSGSYSVTRPAGPYVLHEHTYYSGSFSTPTRASGKARVHVKVTRNGHKAATCDKNPITWHIPAPRS